MSVRLTGLGSDTIPFRPVLSRHVDTKPAKCFVLEAEGLQNKAKKLSVQIPTCRVTDTNSTPVSDYPNHRAINKSTNPSVMSNLAFYSCFVDLLSFVIFV